MSGLVIEPAGRDADQIATLLTWMVVGALVLWIAVTALTAYALASRRRLISEQAARRLIVYAGVVAPGILLSVLLVSGLSLLRPVLALAPPERLHVIVTGEQWWWRVRYVTPSGQGVDLANELRLPRGVRTNVHLRSHDVVHSLWIPALGGKVDMIPGRSTVLPLEPTRSGEFRGVCAEYCGSSHALMALPVVVQERGAFERWLTAQAAPARPALGELAQQGEQLATSYGCGACHAVRGSRAAGSVGPDLTHVGSRRSLGAGILPNDVQGFERWLASTAREKPGVHMPTFGMLPSGDLRALAAYLEGLE